MPVAYNPFRMAEKALASLPYASEILFSVIFLSDIREMSPMLKATLFGLPLMSSDFRLWRSTLGFGQLCHKRVVRTLIYFSFFVCCNGNFNIPLDYESHTVFQVLI